VESVQELVASIESACGRVDMLFHTLGAGRSAGTVDAFSVQPGRGLAVQGSAPLAAALTCSGGAIRHMSRTKHGHVIHLVTRAEVGAIEVERVVLDRLRDLLAEGGTAGSVRMSAIYFDGTSARQIAGPPPESPDSRMLEENTARLVEEDGWIGRVMLEQAIGDMVSEVCSERPLALRTRMESIQFHGGVQPSIERHAIQ
jgi:hypothetical protein